MPKASRSPATRVLLALMVTAVTATGSLATAPAAQRRDAVGQRLQLDDREPMMQPISAPARVARVAVVPGSKIGEAWGIGFSRARKPRYDQTTPAGQVVFLRHTDASGWQVHGPPVDTSGRPVNQLIADLAVASNGEGWAVGGEGAMYRRAPGGRWILQDRRATTNTLFDVALGRDRSGVYGYAVGASLTFLRLDAGTWTVENATGSVPSPGGTIPDLAGVTATSRDEGYALSGSNANTLLIFRREQGRWARILTGRPMFDSPPAPATDGSTVNQFARGASIVGGGGAVWVGGMMQPVDPTKTTGDGADRTRPFALRYADGAFTSFCPLQYRFSSSGVESTVPVCDEPFPFATGDLAALAAAGPVVFAGGSGLFRFRDGRWTRQPSTVGSIVSASFSSAQDGWVATAGEVIGSTGIASSSSNAIGHWTDRPADPRAVRWPHADNRTLEGVAVSPGDGSGAMAVGRGGVILRLDGEAGWQPMDSPTRADLHAIAWPLPRRAWAVGSDGTILRFDGERWARFASPTDEHLFAVAADGGRAVAVGAEGTIIGLGPGGWRTEVSGVTRKLNAVARAGRSFIAVGDKGSILERTARGWRGITSLEDDLRSGQEGENPNLLAVTSSTDGRATIGGARGVLIERSPSGEFTLSRRPDLDGSIHTLASTRTGLVTSVGTQANRFAGRYLGQGHGWLFAGDRRGWTDLMFERAPGTTPEVDAPALRDAVYAIAMEPGGVEGWAVGGFPSNVFDDDGHLRSTSTSSIWRIDLLDRPASSPASFAAEVRVPDDGVSFAFVGDTACASGLCGASLGAGTRADTIARALYEDVNATDGLAFAVNGGDLRRNGIPEELASMRALLRGAGVPSWGVLGDKDLFAGIGPSTGDEQGGLLASNGYYLRAFATEPAPWGAGAPPKGFVPARLPGEAQPDPARARTHYAFDYAPDGAPLLRIVVLDTSRTPLAANVETQNPQQEQTAWLQGLLTDARSKAIPSIVVMHQPLVLPVTTGADASSITGILTAAGASAAIASHVRANLVTVAPDPSVPGSVPVGVFGGGGAPLSRESRPERGAYHAWGLITVRTDPAERTITGQAPVTMEAIPVLESVAVKATRGRTAAAGRTLTFRGLGRIPDVGGAHGLGREADQDQGRATYLRFPFPQRCTLLGAADGCLARDAAEPRYTFTTEHDEIAAFVRADPADPTRPYRDANGRLVRDERGGLLCTFRPGRTAIRLTAGRAGTRIPIEVGAGSGPCTPRIFAPSAALGAQPTDADEPVAAERPEQPQQVLRARVPDAAAVAAVAPPIVNAAPAPPGGGAGQRQEEQEAAGEKAEMTALAVRARRGHTPWTEAAAVVLGAGALAAGLALAARPRRPKPAAALERRRTMH